MNTASEMESNVAQNSEEQKIKKTRNCDVCKTSQMDENSYITHILSRQHIHKLNTLGKNLCEEDCRICVSQYNSNTTAEDIAKTFWVFGIRCVQYTGSYSIVQFECSSAAEVAMKIKYNINGEDVNVRPMMKKVNDLSISNNLTDSISRLNTPIEIEDQISKLISEVEMNDFQSRETIKVEMEKLLQQHFPSVQVFMYGSSTNNLGFHGCDLDMSIELGYGPWTSIIKSVMEKHAKCTFKLIADLLIEENIGYDVQGVPHARVPIVRFKDWNTGIDVDLSLNNKMPVHNTELIYQYTKTHKLVRPYLMFIKYWAKLQEITGGVQRQSHITNYAFTMMMLWYLMYRSPPIVPTVAFLQNSSENNQNIVINGWNFSFSKDITSWEEIDHNVTVMELIQEFFDFYGSVNMKNIIISPYFGTMMTFNSVKEAKFGNNTPICVQDAFDHAHNITASLSKDALSVFQYKCRVSAQICKDILAGSLPLSELHVKINITKKNMGNNKVQVTNVDNDT